MPGEAAMLAEFVGQVEPQGARPTGRGRLREDEAGGRGGVACSRSRRRSRDAVAAAKREWSAGPAATQRTLFADVGPDTRQRRFEFSDLTDDQFFDQAEEQIVDALAVRRPSAGRPGAPSAALRRRRRPGPRLRGRLPAAVRRGADESAVRRRQQAGEGYIEKAVPAHQERPVRGLRRDAGCDGSCRADCSARSPRGPGSS